MPTEPRYATARVLGYRLAAVDLPQASEIVLALASTPVAATALVVTLNPELVVRAATDDALKRAIDDAALVVADGVGILWASRRAGQPLPGRVPGVDLSTSVLAAGGERLRVFFLGGRPGVAEAAAARSHAEHAVAVAGWHHGYFGPEREPDVVEAVRASGAQLLLCGLGERQELFVKRWEAQLGTAVAIGVGGTLDVMAGAARRTPAWTRSWRLEWLWRVGLDPKRWHRIPRLARFVWTVLANRAQPRR